MQYLGGFVVAVALVAAPLSANAQASEEAQEGEEDSLSFWHDEALKIALFSAPPSTSEAYTLELEEIELRVKRARIALGWSVVPLVLGTGLAVGGAFGSVSQLDFTAPPSDTSGQDAILYAGSAIVGAGAVWMITSGIILGVRKRQLRELNYGTPGRVQWDLAQSRLVF